MSIVGIRERQSEISIIWMGGSGVMLTCWNHMYKTYSAANSSKLAELLGAASEHHLVEIPAGRVNRDISRNQKLLKEIS